MVAEHKSNNIKALMHKHGLTIEELANELGVSVSTINRLLVGTKVDPRLSTLTPLAKFFDISIEELIGDKPLNIKPKDANGFPDRHTLLQVPIIHWEQIKNAMEVVPKLSFHNWNRWIVVSDVISNDAYGLEILQLSLPPPFYFHSVVVVDPGREPKDSDYVLILQEGNPCLTRFILNGTKKLYKSLILDRCYFHDDISFCGTVVQWTIFYSEKSLL